MAIRFEKERLDTIRSQGAKAWPDECCGFLAGRRDAAHRVVDVVYAAANRTEHPGAAGRFRIDPEEVWRAIAHARAGGFEIIGFYHSHPDRPPIPSARDGANAWPGSTTVIIEVRRGVPGGIRAWHRPRHSRALHPELIVIAGTTKGIPA